MVNAAQFPGPALWQGLMLILLVPTVFLLFKWPDRMGWIFGGYGIAGLVLMGTILSAH